MANKISVGYISASSGSKFEHENKFRVSLLRENQNYQSSRHKDSKQYGILKNTITKRMFGKNWHLE